MQFPLIRYCTNIICEFSLELVYTPIWLLSRVSELVLRHSPGRRAFPRNKSTSVATHTGNITQHRGETRTDSIRDVSRRFLVRVIIIQSGAQSWLGTVCRRCFGFVCSTWYSKTACVAFVPCRWREERLSRATEALGVYSTRKRRYSHDTRASSPPPLPQLPLDPARCRGYEPISSLRLCNKPEMFIARSHVSRPRCIGMNARFGVGGFTYLASGNARAFPLVEMKEQKGPLCQTRSYGLKNWWQYPRTWSRY